MSSRRETVLKRPGVRGQNHLKQGNMYANPQIARAQPAVAGGTAQHVCQLSKTENKRGS